MSSHSFEVVTYGGTWVRARGLKDKDSFTEREVQQATCVRLKSLLNADAVLPKDASTFMKLRHYSKIGPIA